MFIDPSLHRMLLEIFQNRSYAGIDSNDKCIEHNLFYDEGKLEEFLTSGMQGFEPGDASKYLLLNITGPTLILGIAILVMTVTFVSISYKLNLKYPLVTKSNFFINGIAVGTIFSPLLFATILYEKDASRNRLTSVSVIFAYICQYPLWSYLRAKKFNSFEELIRYRFSSNRLPRIWFTICSLITLIRLQKLSKIITKYFRARDGTLFVVSQILIYILGIIAGVQNSHIFNVLIFIIFFISHLGMESVVKNFSLGYSIECYQANARAESSHTDLNMDNFVRIFCLNFFYQPGYFWFNKSNNKASSKCTFIIGLCVVFYVCSLADDLTDYYTIYKIHLPKNLVGISPITEYLARHFNGTSGMIDTNCSWPKISEAQSSVSTIRDMKFSLGISFTCGLYIIFLTYIYCNYLYTSIQSTLNQNNPLDKWLLSWGCYAFLFQCLLNLLGYPLSTNDYYHQVSSLMACWMTPIFIMSVFNKNINTHLISLTGIIMILLTIIFCEIAIDKSYSLHVYALIVPVIILKILLHAMKILSFSEQREVSSPIRLLSTKGGISESS